MGSGLTMTTRLALPWVIALLLIAITTATTQSQSTRSLPALVQTEISKACDKPPALKPGFVAVKDINGDGVDDYILDYSKFQCGGDSLI
jgi:hypothetical protein